MNYCKTCRRHLNGALSCPGCGATGLELSNIQDARSTVTMPRIEDEADEERGTAAGRAPAAELDYEPSEPLAELPPADRPAAKRQPEARVVRRAGAPASSRAKPVAGPVRHVEPNPVEADEAVEEPEDAALPPLVPVPAPTLALPPVAHARTEPPAVAPADSEDDAGDGEGHGAGEHRGRRASKRGLGLMVTSGCAGIAVIGFLVFGNSGGGSAASTTTVVTTTPVHSTAGGTISIPAAPSSETASSASPSLSPSSSPSVSKSPTHTETSTKAAPTTSSAPSSPSTSPTASRSTTPTPTSSKTFCFLIC